MEAPEIFEEETTECESLRLLHVEDNYADSNIFKELLQHAVPHVTIHSCFDAEEAIAFMNTPEGKKVNIVILDINLPKKKGTEVLYWIKTNESTKTIPTIILTTSLLAEDITFCYEHHANCYIRKPKNLIEYEEVVKSIIDYWIHIVVIPKENKKN